MNQKNSNNNNGVYFGKEVEYRVKQFLTASTEEQNVIFEAYLFDPLMKLAENIMFRYKLYVPNEDIVSQKIDAVSFLMTKIHKFNPNKVSPKSGNPVKAYSYFGTVIKRYFIAKRSKFQKLRNINYSSFDDSAEITYDTCEQINSEKNQSIVNQIISAFVNHCETIVLTGDVKELRVCISDSLAQFLKEADALPIINKNFIYFLIRDQQHIKLAKDITSTLKILQNDYYRIKNEVINRNCISNKFIKNVAKG